MTNPAATQPLAQDEGDHTLRLAHGLRALAGVLLVGGVLTAIVLEAPTGTREEQRPATASEPTVAPTVAPETRSPLDDEELRDRNPIPSSIVVG